MDTRFVQSLYDRRASVYDRVVQVLSLGTDPRYRTQAVRRLELRQGDSVADIGCGTGLNFDRSLRLIGPWGRVVGLDVSLGMLRKARERARANGWANILLVQADAARLPLRSDAFPAAVATYTLSTVEDFLGGLREMVRILGPGGRLVLTDDRLPPGWFLGPLFVLTRLLEIGWPNLERKIYSVLRKELESPFRSHHYFGLIYLVAAHKRGL